MKSYLVSKLKWVLVTLLGIFCITFALMKSIPGDPVYSLVGQRASKQTIELYRAQMGLDKPMFVQAGLYFKMIAKGDLGVSYFSGRKVTDLIIQKFPNTLKLAVCSTLAGIVMGFLLAFIMFFFQRTLIADIVNFISLLLISTPVFWFGLILILVFIHYLHLIPGIGMGRGELVYLILPSITLGSRTAAFIARFLYSELESEQRSKYVATAVAKGLDRKKVLVRHILKNVLIPVVTIIGLDLASYLNGSVLTETVFSWDGVGRLAMDSILKRDYPVILGTVLFGAVFFVFINLLIDVFYMFVNPKIRLGGKDQES